MIIDLKLGTQAYRADLSKPIDISIPLRPGPETVNAFYAPRMKIVPIVAGDFVGDALEGGLVNTKIISVNPHGNGTHTECVGHISTEQFFLNDCLTTFMFPSRLITVIPTELDNGDLVVEKRHFEDADLTGLPALVVRTTPNGLEKLQKNYSGTNPIYFDEAAILYLVSLGVKHLLIDTPSIDREEDEGKLLGHKAFWSFPDAIRKDCTVTELIYVADEVEDGVYLLNLQIMSIESDASPSKPVLYALTE